MKIKDKLFSNRTLRDGGIYLIANIFNKAIAFITIPIFSRLLTTTEYGEVSTYSAYVSIIYFFVGIASEYTIRNAYVDYKRKVSQYMSTMFSMTSLITFICSIIVVIINSGLIHFTTNIICLCCVIQAFMTYVNTAMINMYMMEGAVWKRAIVTAGPNLLSAILGIIFIISFKSNRAFGRIIGYVCAFVIFGVIELGTIWKNNKPGIDKNIAKYILKLSPPLIVHGLSVVALSQIDRVMITAMRGSSETGVYSIIYNLSMVALAVTNVLEGVWIPWFTLKYQNKCINEINKKSDEYLKFVCVLMVAIMLVSPEVLKLLTPKEYWNGINLIPPLVIASFLMYMYSFQISLELYEKKTKQIAVITISAALTNVILNYILIPYYGALAASFTTVISYLVSFLLHARNGHKIQKDLFPFKQFIIPVIIFVVGIIVFYLFELIFWVRWIVTIIMLIMLLYYYLKRS